MKRLIRVAAIGLALLVMLAIALPFLVDANAFRPTLEARLSDALARTVKLGDLKLSLLSGAVEAGDLSIAEDPAFGNQPFVHARAIRIGVELMPLLFSKKLVVTRFVVVEPDVKLIQSAAGAWNFSTLGGKAARTPANREPAGQPLDLTVKLVKIDNGRFAVNQLALEKVDAQLRDFAAFALSAKVVGGGDVQVDGTAGATPTATVKINKLDLAAAHWLPGGIASLDLDFRSDGTVAAAAGKFHAEKLKLAGRGTPSSRPVDFTFTAEHRLADSSGRLTRGDLRVGDAAARLSGSYTAKALRLDLAGENMPVPELAAILPAAGIALPAGSTLQGGTASVKLATEGPFDRPVTTGTVALNDTTLTGFDLGRKLAVIQTLAGIKADPSTKIQTLAGAFRMAPEGTAAENLQLTVPAIGELAGAGTISPANALDFRMTAKVAGHSIPLLVQGTTTDPSFRPDVKSIATEKAKSVAGGLLNRFLGSKKN